MMRVAVFGASGFVGATLVERLWQSGEVDVRPVIHSSGNAARVARFGRPLVTADALQPGTLEAALDGCTHAVNCSRGPAEVMLTGLRNILDASRRAGVQRLVHLSSVAAYGEIQTPELLTEAERPAPSPNTYGWTKHLQDQLVERAQQAGLSCAVLCPPNISGAYSAFLMEIVQVLRRRELALVADGQLPCELIDVENLVHAIRLALQAADPGGGRIFVTDGAATSWADVAAALAPLADHSLPLPTLTIEEARAVAAPAAPRKLSLAAAARHLVSADVRSAVKKDPWFAAAEKSLKGSLKLVPQLERALRRRFEGRPPVRRTRRTPALSERLVGQQLRNVRYSQARARQVLGYRPVVRPDESMAAFRSWYGELCGWNQDAWALTRHLYE